MFGTRTMMLQNVDIQKTYEWECPTNKAPTKVTTQDRVDQSKEKTRDNFNSYRYVRLHGGKSWR